MIAHVKIQFEINSQRFVIREINGILVIAHVKIQFEINSQHIANDGVLSPACDCSRKNTI